MKTIVLLLVLIVLALAPYLSKKQSQDKAHMIQDSVESGMAAPRHAPEIPF